MMKNGYLGLVWAIFMAKIISTRFGMIFEKFKILKFFPAKISKISHFWPSNFQSWPISGQKIFKMSLSRSYLFPKKMPEIGRKNYGSALKNVGKRHFSHFWPERVQVDFHFLRHNSTFSCTYSKSSESQLSPNIYTFMMIFLTKKSYSTLKFQHTTISHLCIEFSCR